MQINRRPTLADNTTLPFHSQATMEGQRFLTDHKPDKRIDSGDKGLSRPIFLQKTRR
jgi:hypothetical protein